MRYPVPRDFRLRFEDLVVVASGMQRPECVLAFATGELVASDARGGVAVIDRSGAVEVIAARSQERDRFVPNGVAIAPDGRALIANLGAERGGIFRLDADGTVAGGGCGLRRLPLRNKQHSLPAPLGVA
jgi:sugar lactone lactonase YvrE